MDNLSVEMLIGKQCAEVMAAIPELIQLSNDLLEHLHAICPDKTESPKYFSHEDLVRNYDNGYGFCVARIGTEIVGMCWVAPYDEHLYLYMLYVRPEYRHQGIAKSIINCIEHYAINAACTGLDLDVALYNMGLAGFYETLGYRQDRMTFTKKISQ